MLDEAKALASAIAKRERLHEDVVFADAMHVAVALALSDDELEYTKRNVAWMFDRIHPGDVHGILTLRWQRPDDYELLPMANATEGLSTAEMQSANGLAKTLTREQLDAFFFSDEIGRA
jgi:hypothetical protein